MRRWIGLAAALYPGSWRARYGEEFEALLEDHKPGWREFTDVLRGALKMQMTNATGYLKLAGGLAIAGAVAAAAISFSLPRIYESTAVIRMTPPRDSQRPAAQGEIQDRISSQLNQMEEEILSRTSLEGLITQPSLDLYQEERSREPMEDIVQRMRTRYIRIRTLNPPGASGAGPAFSVSFSYPDRLKAQAVVRQLTTKFVEQNVVANRWQARVWQAVWPQKPPPSGPDIEVLDPPSIPQKAINANPLSFGLVGLLLGLMLGTVAAVAIKWPKRMLVVAGFAVGCGVLATASSFLLPDNYTSMAVVRITKPLVPADLTRDVDPTPPAKKFQQLEGAVLSDASLEAIITNPALDLYKKQRSRKPMKEILEAMRRDLSVRAVEPSHAAFVISFSYPDRFKAQAVVRDLVTRFVEQNVRAERARAEATGDPIIRQIAQYKVGDNIEVLDPPSDPQAPVSPNRLAISLAGFGLGIILGAATLYFRRQRIQLPRLRQA